MHHFCGYCSSSFFASCPSQTQNPKVTTVTVFFWFPGETFHFQVWDCCDYDNDDDDDNDDNDDDDDMWYMIYDIWYVIYEYMNIWIYEYMNIWIYAYMNIWIYA